MSLTVKKKLMSGHTSGKFEKFFTIETNAESNGKNQIRELLVNTTILFGISNATHYMNNK